MQEETPLAPAQIMASVILVPQYLLQLVLDRRGRDACCSRSGVLASGRAEWVVSDCAPRLPASPPVVARGHPSLTGVSGQAPARGGAYRPSSEAVTGAGQAHGGHGLGEARRCRQLQQGDVGGDG